MNENLNQKLYDAIATIQVEIGDIPQSGVGYGYSYSTLQDIWERLAPLLEKYGLGIISMHRYDAEMGWVLETRVFLREDPNVYTSTIMPMSLPILERQGKAIQGVLAENLMPGTPQEWGSITTYWRRYSVVNLLWLVSGVPDDDAQIAQHSMAERSREVISNRPQRMKRAENVGKPLDNYEDIKKRIKGYVDRLIQEDFQFTARGDKTAQQRRTTSQNLGMVKLKVLLGEYARDFLRDLFGADDLKLLTDPEIQAIWQWMEVSRERDWQPSPRAEKEAEIIVNHFSGAVPEDTFQF